MVYNNPPKPSGPDYKQDDRDSQRKGKEKEPSKLERLLNKNPEELSPEDKVYLLVNGPNVMENSPPIPWEEVNDYLYKPFESLPEEHRLKRIQYKFQNRLLMKPEEHIYVLNHMKSDQKDTLEKETKEKTPKKEGFVKKLFSRIKGKSEPKEKEEKSPRKILEPMPDLGMGKDPAEPNYRSSPSMGHEAEENNLLFLENAFFEKATVEEINKLQPHIENINKTYPSLKIDHLSPELLPLNKIRLDNATYYCSDPVQLGIDESPPHLGVVGLIEINGKIYPRVFYESLSQGCWRVSPGIDKSGDVIGFLNKGIGESSTQLPLKLNFNLQKLAASSKKMNKKLKILSVKESHPLAQTRDFYGRGKLEFSYPNAVKSEELVKTDDRAAWRYYHDPKSIQIKNPDLVPNFSNEIGKFIYDSPIYGRLIGRVFNSKNEEAQYLFYENNKGKIFLAGLDLLKKDHKKILINKYGVRELMPELDGLDSPLLEYRENMGEKSLEQTYWPNYDFLKESDKKYLSFWNYVKEIPVIQEYYRSRNLPVPGRD